MIKKIIKVIFLTFLFMIVLGIGGYSFSSFKHAVDMKNPDEVFEPVVDNLPDIDLPDVDLPDVDVTEGELPETTETETSTEMPNTTEEFQTELPPADVTFPPRENISEIEFSTTKNIKVTINGKSIELTSTTTLSFIKWLGQNYSDESKVEYEELEPTETTTESNNELTYNNILSSEDELLILSDSINIIDKLPELEGYDRDKYEGSTKTYKLDGETYNRNDFAWKVSDFLISEDPFEYICPYTGETITDESKLDFDHIVSLRVVEASCPDDWTDEDKNNYAYNIGVGIDVSYSANRSKGSKTPSEWLPNENIEDYCYTYLVICSKYNLVMTEADLTVCYDNIILALNQGETVSLLNSYLADDSR